MSNRNRTAGHNWERKVINDLKEIGYNEAVSSRQASRETDNAGIDICNTGDIAIQCKNTAKNIDYFKINKSMNTGKHKIIVHKRTEKTGEVFKVQGKYAIIEYDFLLKLLASWKE
jgi:hypothetical protein